MDSALETIEEFLSKRRIAVVGVSRREKDFTRIVAGELRKHGYDLVFVNPRATEIDGAPCFAKLEDISPPVEGALLFTPPAVTEEVVRDCELAGIRLIWMHRGAGHGAVSDKAVRFCKEKGLGVVAGACPLMFLSDAGWIHRAHGFFSRKRILRRACGEEAEHR
jgi:predicted CoA-binding protein